MTIRRVSGNPVTIFPVSKVSTNLPSTLCIQFIALHWSSCHCSCPWQCVLHSGLWQNIAFDALWLIYWLTFDCNVVCHISLHCSTVVGVQKNATYSGLHILCFLEYFCKCLWSCSVLNFVIMHCWLYVQFWIWCTSAPVHQVHFRWCCGGLFANVCRVALYSSQYNSIALWTPSALQVVRRWLSSGGQTTGRGSHVSGNRHSYVVLRGALQIHKYTNTQASLLRGGATYSALQIHLAAALHWVALCIRHSYVV